MSSSFGYEIWKILKALIFSLKTNLFLTELILKWPITVFKTLSTLSLQISRMPLLTKKDSSVLLEEWELEPVSRKYLLCSQKDSTLSKEFLKFLGKADIQNTKYPFCILQ